MPRDELFRAYLTPSNVERCKALFPRVSGSAAVDQFLSLMLPAAEALANKEAA